jgi:hypothetical protein
MYACLSISLAIVVDTRNGSQSETAKYLCIVKTSEVLFSDE